MQSSDSCVPEGVNSAEPNGMGLLLARNICSSPCSYAANLLLPWLISYPNETYLTNPNHWRRARESKLIPVSVYIWCLSSSTASFGEAKALVKTSAPSPSNAGLTGTRRKFDRLRNKRASAGSKSARTFTVFLEYEPGLLASSDNNCAHRRDISSSEQVRALSL